MSFTNFAAQNAGGRTFHDVCCLNFNGTPREMPNDNVLQLKMLDLIIIDEISQTENKLIGNSHIQFNNYFQDIFQSAGVHYFSNVPLLMCGDWLQV